MIIQVDTKEIITGLRKWLQSITDKNIKADLGYWVRSIIIPYVKSQDAEYCQIIDYHNKNEIFRFHARLGFVEVSIYYNPANWSCIFYNTLTNAELSLNSTTVYDKSLESILFDIFD